MADKTSVVPIIEMIEQLIERIRGLRLRSEREYERRRALNTLEGVTLVLKALCESPSDLTWWEELDRQR